MNICYSTLNEENVLAQNIGCTNKEQVQHNINLRNLNTVKRPI